MSIESRLAKAQGRRDEAPNVELAVEVASRGDKRAVVALIALATGPTRAPQGDAIKVLYEIAAREPKLLRPHLDALFEIASRRNNRLRWGALTALDAMSELILDPLQARLPELLVLAEGASVITRDRLVSILCKLIAAGRTKVALPAALSLLREAPGNQLPAYAEQLAPAIPVRQRTVLAKLLKTRVADLKTPAKRRRVQRVLDSLGDLAG